MRTIGIIAEYNPFHSGHRYQLDTLRQSFPDCAVVCCMSGHFVQRGDAALADKWIRAKLALQGGADLILDLPTLWAAASAETFARGGVFLLNATGVVDTLSFGSEAGNLAPLRAVAGTLDSPALRDVLRAELDKGLSFPAARQRAAEQLLGDQAACLRHPNNNLGIEYLRALTYLGSPIRPHTLARVGAGHDRGADGGHASASYLRERILSRDPSSLLPYLDEGAEPLLRRDPAALAFCEKGVLAQLRRMTEADFQNLPDSGDGAAQRLYAAVQQADSLAAVYDLARTRRLTHARIRRLVLWAFLGLTQADRPEHPPYLRVLGFSARGQQLLRQMKKTATLPVVVKPSQQVELDDTARRVLALEARCTRLYDLCRREFGTLPGINEFTRSPVRIP